MPIRLIAIGILVFTLSAWAQPVLENDPQASFEFPPIHYDTTPLDTPVTRLQRDLETGRQTLHQSDRWGYLLSVLRGLDIHVDSQTLVFSKTSFQNDFITPQTPRAVYFNDHSSVGWTQQGDELEISSLDPHQGVIFYTLNQHAASPRFVRNNRDCLRCHSNFRTQGVPGLVVRSIDTLADGSPRDVHHDIVADHAVPVSDRWGGWYVSGTYGGLPHWGNAADPRSVPYEQRVDRQSLDTLLNLRPYASAHSDIVALSVLEHQSQMTNLMVRANFMTRLLMARQAEINTLNKLPDDALDTRTRHKIDRHAEALVRYMLFADEAPLKAPLIGTSGFTERFTRRGPKDTRGRSLYALDLKTRLLQYPCSYMIYSEAFNGLPDVVRQRVFDRLHEILTADKSPEDYSSLSDSDRAAIVQILKATHRHLPKNW